MTDVDGGPLAEWLSSLHFFMLQLEDVERAEDGLVLDYSGTSLRALEQVLLGEFGDEAHAAAVSFAGDWDFLVAAAAYLGETLMRLAGGSWDWTDEEGGMAWVRPDPAVGLDPVEPLRVLMDAMTIGDGEQLTALYRRWETAVERRQQTEPGWAPHKEPTDLDRPAPSGDFLPGWLAERAESFPTWVATYAPEETWDFFPDSLSALEDLVRREATTSADLYGPALRELADGATWYLGEVVRRGLGGEWNYNDGDASDENLPYVDGIGPRDGLSLAGIVVRNVPDRPAGYLRSHYENVA